MIRIRRSEERGSAHHGWLETRHTFSFASYHDPEHMGFRVLRVINEDTIRPASGFGTHPHEDMEIVTYILAGSLKHEDGTGTGSVLRAGDVQRMTAGRGILHSEANPSTQDDLCLLQIWILPGTRGLDPGYEEKSFPDERKRNRLCPIVTPDGRDGSLVIHQDASIFASILGIDRQVEHPLGPDRHAWIQVACGGIQVNGAEMSAGDGAAASGEDRLRIVGRGRSSEFLLFDLP